MDAFFITIHQWLSQGSWIAGLGALLWGMISVLLSPCHLASIPLIVAYVGGQERVVEGRQAALYAVLFSVGLFITIGVVGVITALLGRILGDIGPYWGVFIGLILLVVAMDMLGLARCSIPGSLMGRFQVRGAMGALILGLAYGVLSGSCTFGFIAPILAIITVQEKIMGGILLITLFGIGHCLPIAVAGSSTATVKKLLASSTFGTSSTLFRKAAGVLIGGLGLYFILSALL